jgi:pimeloyl-ACP methyl ester carboxylesterase
MCDARLWRGGDGVIIQRLRDHGISSVFDADLTQDDNIAAMAERALSATQGPLLPIGFSMGAIVAVEMAKLAPQRIIGLVLAGYNATADLPERAAHRPIQQGEVRAGGLERVLVEELKPNYLAAQNRDNHTLRELLRDMGMSFGADVFIRQSEALRLREDQRAGLSMLDVPVLYMCGAEDALCPPDWHRTWEVQTRNARFEDIIGAGHMLPLEAPVLFAGILDRWLTKNMGEFT